MCACGAEKTTVPDDILPLKYPHASTVEEIGEPGWDGLRVMPAKPTLLPHQRQAEDCWTCVR